MAAPVGNKFWKLRSKHGREKIFDDPQAMLDAAYEYFEWNSRNPWYKNEAIKSGENAGDIIHIPVERPLTLEGLCMFWGATTRYLEKFEKTLKPEDEDFIPVIAHIREVIRRQKLEGATIGTFNASIVARELGLADKQSHEHTGKDGSPIETSVNIKADLSNLTDDELRALIEIQSKIGTGKA